MATPFDLINRQTIRSTPNPLDKSTVVSIFPRKIVEVKPTLLPGRFVVPAGTYDNPGILVVESSSWWKETSPDEPLLEIPTNSVLIAESVCRDWMNGIIGCDMESRKPGMFFIPGEHNAVQVKAEYKDLLDRAREKQTNWFKHLIELADISWARTNGSPLGITDDMRLAAEELNVKDRDWFRGVVLQNIVKCVACGNLNNADVIICPNCKVILDQKRYDELKLRTA